MFKKIADMLPQQSIMTGSAEWAESALKSNDNRYVVIVFFEGAGKMLLASLGSSLAACRHTVGVFGNVTVGGLQLCATVLSGFREMHLDETCNAIKLDYEKTAKCVEGFFYFLFSIAYPDRASRFIADYKRTAQKTNLSMLPQENCLEIPSPESSSVGSVNAPRTVECGTQTVDDEIEQLKIKLEEQSKELAKIRATSDELEGMEEKFQGKIKEREGLLEAMKSAIRNEVLPLILDQKHFKEEFLKHLNSLIVPNPIREVKKPTGDLLKSEKQVVLRLDTIQMSQKIEEMVIPQLQLHLKNEAEQLEVVKINNQHLLEKIENDKKEVVDLEKKLTELNGILYNKILPVLENIKGLKKAESSRKDIGFIEKQKSLSNIKKLKETISSEEGVALIKKLNGLSREVARMKREI